MILPELSTSDKNIPLWKGIQSLFGAFHHLNNKLLSCISNFNHDDWWSNMAQMTFKCAFCIVM